jgi:large subunit ribosomal protein L23
MNLSEVLVKPILTEKANSQQEKLRRYAFRVNRKANKLEIKKAVEDFYGVTVVDVNTSVVPGKNKTRFTKAGYVQGRKPAYKKALITVADGESIDLYAAI